MAAENNGGAVKIAGYLDKKKNLKVMSTWKKYWFVLEGRLLLYYRSQAEYENLSPCKGSINMGLATGIRPGLATAGIFQIITRTNTITLRTKERIVQEKWLQALLDSCGQSNTVSNKLSHFRYSMDNIPPTENGHSNHGQKSNLVRQKTLPYRTAENPKLERKNSLILRIRQMGGQTYCGSLDAISKTTNKGKREKIESEEPKKQTNEETVKMENDMYSTVDKKEKIVELRHVLDKDEQKAAIDKSTEEMIRDSKEIMRRVSELMVDNVNYRTISDLKRNSDPAVIDHNKNCMVENDQYIPGEIKANSADDIEYYCTYEDIAAMRKHDPEYVEPQYESPSGADDPNVETKEKKTRVSSLMSFIRRSKGGKERRPALRKHSQRLVNKILRRKRNQKSDEDLYETVDYAVLKKDQESQKVIETLTQLEQKLLDKKIELESILSSKQALKSPKNVRAKEEKPENVETTESDVKPELPARHVSRTSSSHSVAPRNSSSTHEALASRPTSSQGSQNTEELTVLLRKQLEKIESGSSDKRSTIDKILDDLEKQPHSTVSSEVEMNVRQLIEKFDAGSRSSKQECAVDNRHSNELNKLLEELTKITTAPLMEPGATCSLVQVRSDALTDEEWMALVPIRRRRLSEPDYDVPRPHRSLQILPRSPKRSEQADDTVIPATRFFGPVLPTTSTSDSKGADRSTTSQSISWSNMTPDSLEPQQVYDAMIHSQKKAQNGNKDDCVRPQSHSEKLSFINEENLEDRIQIIEKHSSNCPKTSDYFFDSLEHYSELSTSF